MRDRGHPWKWPVCIGLAFALVLGTVFLIPQHWIEAFFSPLALDKGWENEQKTKWMILQPPPQVEILPDRRVEPPRELEQTRKIRVHQDPDWWVQGVAIRPLEVPRISGPEAVPDSVMILLAALGVSRDFMTRARPDSVLASRLFMMQIEDSFKFDELKPYLSAMARARDFADIMSRAADMYDDFLRTEIMTPD
jgi:hypothetical protein